MAGEKPKKSDNLTPKQEAFALVFFECGNATEAYRQAYDVNPNTKDNWVHVEACQLLDNPKVARRVQELRDQAAKHSIYTRQKALEELELARHLAMQATLPSAAVAAVANKVKLMGLDRPLKVDHTSSDGTMTPKAALDVSKLSTKELGSLVELLDKAQEGE